MDEAQLEALEFEHFQLLDQHSGIQVILIYSVFLSIPRKKRSYFHLG